MNTRAMSRRTLLEVGVSAVVGTAGVPALTIAHAETGISANCEVAVRKYYTAWEQKDWEPFDRLLADNFTFTSANNDDHISKGEFKKRCWDTQAEFISHFGLLRVFGHDNEAFVMYVGHTKNGKLTSLQPLSVISVRSVALPRQWQSARSEAVTNRIVAPHRIAIENLCESVYR
jgi:hypothetical protein